MLIIPAVYKEKLNPYSNFLTEPYNKYSLRDLFLKTANMQYLMAQVIFLLKNDNYLKICDEKKECREPKTRKQIFQKVSMKNIEPFIMEAQKKRNFEFPLLYTNPVMDLHELNKKLIFDTAEQIVLDPGLIDSDYDRTFLGKFEDNNPTGTTLSGGYSQYSLRGDTWHPEDLFLDTPHNRANPYYVKEEIWLDPSAIQPGNRVRFDYMQQFNSNMLNGENMRGKDREYFVGEDSNKKQTSKTKNCFDHSNLIKPSQNVGLTGYNEFEECESFQNNTDPYAKYFNKPTNSAFSHSVQKNYGSTREKKNPNISAIPFWQNPNKRRNYADISEGLRSDNDKVVSPPFATFDMNSDLTKRKYNGTYYLRFPESGEWDCKKMDEVDYYNYY